MGPLLKAMRFPSGEKTAPRSSPGSSAETVSGARPEPSTPITPSASSAAPPKTVNTIRVPSGENLGITLVDPRAVGEVAQPGAVCADQHQVGVGARAEIEIASEGDQAARRANSSARCRSADRM